MQGLMRLMGIGVLLAIVAAGVAACQVGLLRIVNGSGRVQTERREVRDFTAVEVRGGGELVIEQGTTEALTIEAEENLLPYLTSDVSKGRLILGERETMVIVANKPIRYRLTVKDLRAIKVSGSADVEAAKLQTGRLTVDISGSGHVEIGQLAATSLTVELSGSGIVTLAGTAATQQVTLSGSGDYRAEDLASQAATVNISGSGSATVRASDTLTAKVSGSGEVSYLGTPRVEQTVSGSGSVRQRAAR